MSMQEFTRLCKSKEIVFNIPIFTPVSVGKWSFIFMMMGKSLLITILEVFFVTFNIGSTFAWVTFYSFLKPSYWPNKQSSFGIIRISLFIIIIKICPIQPTILQNQLVLVI